MIKDEEEKEDKIFRLVGVETYKVDFVDKGANRKTFFLTKRDSEMEDVKIDLEGVDTKEIENEIKKTSEEIEKPPIVPEQQEQIDPPVIEQKQENKVASIISAVISKLTELQDKANKAQTEEEQKMVMDELNAVIGSMVEEPGPPVEEPLEMKEKQTEEKAEWATEYINNLPDAAFAGISEGGEKDEENKTKPRTLRHLPHHNDQVKNGMDHDTVDLDHLRNALARVSQVDASEALKEKMLLHLQNHADTLLGKDDQTNNDEIYKSGKKISRTRMEQLTKFKTDLEELMKKFDSFIKSVEQIEEKTETKKCDDSLLKSLYSKIDDLQKKNIEQLKQLKIAKSVVQSSNNNPILDNEKSGQMYWPEDIAK